MNHQESFPPDTVDEQVEQFASVPAHESLSPEIKMIHHLAAVYEADQRSTERVWNRLTQRLAQSEATVQAASSEPEAAFERRKEREPSMQTAWHPTRRTPSRLLAQVAAVAVAVLLVGSLLWVLHMAQVSHTQTGANLTTQTGAQSAPPPGIYINRSDGAYRLDIQTHKVIWHAHVAEQTHFPASPTVIGDSVYITSGAKVFALNAQTGALRWSHIFPQNVGSPTVDSGLLYFNTGGILRGIISVLHAVNPANGSIVATYTPIQGQEYWNSPIVVDNVLYYTASSNLYAVQLPGEKLLWQQQMSKQMLSTGLSAHNGVVYVQMMRYQQGKQSQAGFIDAFDAHSGHRLWQSPPLPRMVRTVTVTDTMIYAAAFEDVAAFDVHTHAIAWHQPLNAFSIQQVSGNLYISYGLANIDAYEIAVLNATTGKLLWKTNSSNGIEITGILNGIVYGIGASNDGKEVTVYALNASTGVQLWTMEEGPFSQWGGIAVA